MNALLCVRILDLLFSLLLPDHLSVIVLHVIHISISTLEYALGMLFALLPESLVLATILPVEAPLAVFLVLRVVAFKATTVRPFVHTSSIHLVFLPLTHVFATIRPCVDAMPLDLVVHEVSLISGAVLPVELAVAVLLPVSILTNELRTVWPVLLPLPILLVTLPIALVLGSVEVMVDSVA